MIISWQSHVMVRLLFVGVDIELAIKTFMCFLFVFANIGTLCMDNIVNT